MPRRCNPNGPPRVSAGAVELYDKMTRTEVRVITSTLETRVRRELEELPGVSLTLAQVGRLCGLSADECEQVLASLVSEGIIVVTADRQYTVAANRPKERRAG
jgi:hypothetical protein